MRKVLLLGLMLFLGSAIAFAQSRVITGTVTSAEDGMGVPGATILVKGTQIGVATDIDGKYSINVPSGSNVLVYSFVGLLTQEVSIGNKSVIDVTLQSDVTALGEVIVTGYGTQPKREVTGAVSSVRGEAIQNLPLQSFDRALQGRASGVQVRSSNGLPGGAVNIRIRGVGSINAGNEPLFIVDGVQLNNQSNAAFTQSNPLAFLNPNDIESMEILKDAASAAIYGSQAANGVVIITTKKGKQGKARFEFNAFGGQTQPLRYLDVLGGAEWYEMRRDAYINSGNTLPQANALNNMGRLPSNWQQLTPQDLDQIGLDLPTFDWQRAVMGTGNLQNYELSVSGGDEKTTFFLSGSYNYQESSFKPVDFERGTVKIALSHQANSRLNIETNVNLSTFQQNIPFAVSGAFLGNPAFSASAVLPHNPIFNEDGTFNTSIGGVLGQNVVLVNEYNSGLQRNNAVVGNLVGTYKILNNLSFRSLYGLDYRLLQGESYRDPRTPDGAGVRGRASVQQDWRTRFITTQTLNWNKSFNGVHNVSAILGFEFLSETREGLSGAGIGFPTFQFRTIQSAATPESITGFWTGYRRISGFASANYDYKKKYLATVTARYDGSSRFGANNRFGVFPSIRVGWSMVEEEFLKESTAVSELKLRASFGVTGNDQIGNFAARGLYGGAGNYSGSAGIRPSSLANLNLGWETNQTLNFGVDYGFVNNRITGSIDVFDRRTKDLLLDQPILWTNGFGDIANNVGELQNRGIEFELSTVNIDRGGFRWNTTFNFTTIENKVISLYDGLEALPANPGIAVGQPVGNPAGVGDTAPGSWFVAKYAGVNPATGRPMWFDINGNITYLPLAADRQYFGSNLATIYGGLNNSISYKGFELTAFFTYEYGAIVSDGQYNFLRENGTRLTLNALREVNDRAWTTPGQITDIPRNLTTNAGNETRGAGRNSGSANLLKADFIRLSQLTLGYTFKSSLVSQIGLTKARVYVQGLNLWTYTDYPGYDPEFTGAGTGQIPLTKNYTVGVQIGF
ncbi:TonB-linked outer membrane protein, SusC/RagA family [Algoriphagus ornithinivorans]|uniref:TonB-linked outer membrane protein, SusC/RagA family n=1 Tax=Algoriphagus ornithinivorans TaxID=226506 RepID=A0A1I5APQ3_9BACT|nr:TonB-dependent receptor [Algoriphagus ornithinivorans]SFN64444.1 TonB-linked outer membrane protein, SusC/RagA family [Algoriphagus ornithinivorans]